MTKTDDGILDSAVFSGGDRRTFVGACKMGVVSGCLVATIVLLCMIVVSALLRGMTAWMVWCLSCIGAGIAGGIFQQLWFNYLPTRRFAYSTRLFLFGVTYFVVLVACAYLGNWLPRENPYATAPAGPRTCWPTPAGSTCPCSTPGTAPTSTPPRPCWTP